ncbi:MAG: Crp/Fnr family transcriptional regulator [Clostridiales bacterium]|jgi:CRP/FNR family transcriptional regulator|nr:Crp/Fnr family transcriptional regulator [Eubacteriales bacterium]MDH7566455.1 Crp/Fnr family transcriptional regulator [Clostridiales bacterium]
MNEKRYLCLYDIPIFSGLNKESFKNICTASNKQRKAKGEVLFSQGDAADSVYVVKEGSFKLIHTTKDGDEVILQIVSTGEILGESALFRRDTVQPLTAVAMEDSKVCSIDKGTFEKVIKSEPDLAWQIIENLGNRLYNTWEQVAESNTQTTRERVLSLLMRLAQKYGESCPQGTCIKIHLTQQEIASLVGVSRVMASQVINDLIKDDLLCREKKYYILKNRCF